jgi:single-strand DNA-binding protein
MLNRVTLIGNLGKDPEVRRLENGIAVATFAIATNESFQDKNGEWQQLTEWHTVVAWRQLAERAERLLRKGSLVYVEGKLTHRKFTDREGKERFITEVLVNTFRALDKREASTGSYNAPFPSADDAPPTYNDRPSRTPSNTPAPASPIHNMSAPPQSEDDLPF